MELTPRQKAMREVLIRARDEDRYWYSELISSVMPREGIDDNKRHADMNALFQVSYGEYEE